jgi:hypothetical protein
MSDLISIDIGEQPDKGFSFSEIEDRINKAINLVTNGHRDFEYLKDWKCNAKLRIGETIKIEFHIPTRRQLILGLDRATTKCGGEQTIASRREAHKRIDARFHQVFTEAKNVYEIMARSDDPRFDISIIEARRAISMKPALKLALGYRLKRLRVSTPTWTHQLRFEDIRPLFAVPIEGLVRFHIESLSGSSTRANCRIMEIDQSFQRYLREPLQPIELGAVMTRSEIEQVLMKERHRRKAFVALVRVAVSSANFKSCTLEAIDMRDAADRSDAMKGGEEMTVPRTRAFSLKLCSPP